jgi:regulator of sigma E protease
MSFSWLAPVLVLGLVILVHEAGHFWAAKLFGVYAPRFAIGFGPPLWRKRWGETEYVIGMLPLGGYVRMASREDEATRALEGELTESKGGGTDAQDPNALIPFGPLPVPPDRWFESKPLWQRTIILLAGVSMNVVLAVATWTLLLAVYGREAPRPVIAEVVANTPAARAGIGVGDSIVSIDGALVRQWGDLTAIVTEAPGKELRFGIVRAGKPVEVRVTPMATPDTNATTKAVRTIGRLGVYPVLDHIPVGRALTQGAGKTWEMGATVVATLSGLVTGKIGVKELGGPIAIVRGSVVAARVGFSQVLFLIALLSVNLAILNLVPIPLLDGGQIVM